jgi:hypothetical protein
MSSVELRADRGGSVISRRRRPAAAMLSEDIDNI